MPEHLDVYVVLDNSSTHKTPAIQLGSVGTSIANWNDDPKPFVWHKTADQILDTLAAYCARINDSAH